MLPFWRRKETLTGVGVERPRPAVLVWLYRVEDGPQYDLVGAALQDDLNVPL